MRQIWTADRFQKRSRERVSARTCGIAVSTVEAPMAQKTKKTQKLADAATAGRFGFPDPGPVLVTARPSQSAGGNDQ